MKHTTEINSFHSSIHSCTLIYEQLQLQGLKHKKYLSLSEYCLTASNVAATFHPTIGQCAHQSLSNTTTLELGVIPPRNKELSSLTHSQEYNQTQPSQHSWIYQATDKQANILLGLSNYSHSSQHSH